MTSLMEWLSGWMPQKVALLVIILVIILKRWLFWLEIDKRRRLNSIIDARIATVPLICDRCKGASNCAHIRRVLPKIEDARLAYREQLARDLYTIHSSSDSD